uniref:hypothetical protein n=1 Tax=Acetomicrobium sp. S15 = DSM 107314 TaxID=2529858 RepID=UPI0018E10D13
MKILCISGSPRGEHSNTFRLGKEVVPWMYEKRIAFIGTDQWSTEVVPMEDPDEAWPVHCETIAKRG